MLYNTFSSGVNIDKENGKNNKGEYQTRRWAINLFRKFKYLIAFILFIILSQFYLDWIRETFPPTSALFIRLTSGLISGIIFSFFFIPKFYRLVSTNKELLPNVAIVRAGPDKDAKFYINPHSATEAFQSLVGYILLRIFPRKDAMRYRQTKIIITIGGLIWLFIFLFSIS